MAISAAQQLPLRNSRPCRAPAPGAAQAGANFQRRANQRRLGDALPRPGGPWS